MYDPHRWMGFLADAMTDAEITGPADLCRRAGISPSLYSRWESARRQPGNRALQKLAPVLGVPVRRLLIEAGHFEEYELLGGDDALAEILGSPTLSDAQKLRLIEEWRKEGMERERRFAVFVERFLARVTGSTESKPLP